MRAYGLPRDDCVRYPDLADIRYYGLKSCAGRIPRHGEFRSYFKNSRIKRSTRRYWKRKERRFGKSLCKMNRGHNDKNND